MIKGRKSVSKSALIDRFPVKTALIRDSTKKLHVQKGIIFQGRLVGAATVTRLHADPTFRVYVEEAKAELAAVRARGLKPTRDCEAEAAEISVKLTD